MNLEAQLSLNLKIKKIVRYEMCGNIFLNVYTISFEKIKKQKIMEEHNFQVLQ